MPSRLGQHRYCQLLTLGLLFAAQASLANDRALRFSVNDSWAMPMVRIEAGQAVGGILFDLQQRLATKVGRQARMLVMPRLRVQQALENGDIDVRCYVSPNWLGSGHHRYIWSLPFMTQRDLLVGREKGTLRPEQLRNQRLGTVLGFTYPSLEPLFADGRLRREDARTQEQVLLKLQAGRYPYAVSNDLSLHWFNRQHPTSPRLHALGEISSDPIACIVRDAPDVPTMALLRAMVQMKQAGEFEAILRAYR
ncbi:substrate-binding periplasmic protein [Pseudomonas xionganensis]|uniref:Transporter substrate-binding domain-containing protein n=1 Tax=Pseudomonas xionganensis TaxID=2654845 RepID=A0A6I4L2L9_9PSED|nr:ABC transporter substrate-binding protein [Pseudomonas xionganensis]MVW76213.1 transporter substrate-binding domain-containing protein [Pseudomonas xionganensis]